MLCVVSETFCSSNLTKSFDQTLIRIKKTPSNNKYVAGQQLYCMDTKLVQNFTNFFR